MSDIYFMSHPNVTQAKGFVHIRNKGRLGWAFCELCEDGFTFLSKPTVLIVRLLNEKGLTQKVRVLRFRKQENLNDWVSDNVYGLRKEGYNVSYVD